MAVFSQLCTTLNSVSEVQIIKPEEQKYEVRTPPPFFFCSMVTVNLFVLNKEQTGAHRTATEILQEEGKALDDGEMFGAVFSGVADEDFGPRPRSVCAQGCGLRGRLRALFVQVGVDVLCGEIRDERVQPGLGKIWSLVGGGER